VLQVAVRNARARPIFHSIFLPRHLYIRLVRPTVLSLRQGAVLGLAACKRNGATRDTFGKTGDLVGRLSENSFGVPITRNQPISDPIIRANHGGFPGKFRNKSHRQPRYLAYSQMPILVRAEQLCTCSSCAGGSILRLLALLHPRVDSAGTCTWKSA
jgi:hypothetical protein